MRYWLHRIVIWWRLLGRKHMLNIAVGIRNDGTVDLDLVEEPEKDKPEPDWQFNNLSIEETEFLVQELTHALERARARKAILSANEIHSS